MYAPRGGHPPGNPPPPDTRGRTTKRARSHFSFMLLPPAGWRLVGGAGTTQPKTRNHFTVGISMGGRGSTQPPEPRNHFSVGISMGGQAPPNPRQETTSAWELVWGGEAAPNPQNQETTSAWELVWGGEAAPNPQNKETTSAWELVQTKPTAELGGLRLLSEGPRDGGVPRPSLDPTSGISTYFYKNFFSKLLLQRKTFAPKKILYYIIE
jgi:hypothetical protein